MRDHTYMGMRQQLHQIQPAPEPLPSGPIIITIIIIGLTALLWICLAHPTPAERTRVLDSTGKTTGVNWR
jgi:hypothetical protein